MDRQVPYAAALATENLGERVTVTTREQRAEAVDPSIGVVFTVFNGSHFSESATNNFSEDNLRQTAKRLTESAAMSMVKAGIMIDPGEPLTKDFSVSSITDNSSVTLSEK